MKCVGIKCLLIVAVIFALICLSCSQGSCFEETEAYVKASFVLNKTKKAPDSLTVYGVGSDSLWYDKATTILTAKFPLNPSTGTCRFVVRINGVSDTIEFSYTSYPHFISKECGYTFYHHLESEPVTTTHKIKQIYTGDRTITNLNVENLRIYY